MDPPDLPNGFAFKSDVFNTTEPKKCFINPCCFGDDAASWLIARLREKGITTDERPDQEDFGWFFTFEVLGEKYDFLISYRPDEDPAGGDWLCWVERRAGLVGTMLGRRKNVNAEAHETIHQILLSSPVISAVRSGALKDL